MAQRKSQITVTSRADQAKTRNTVLARRLSGGNIHGAGGSREIPLKDKGFYTRIENNFADESMHYRMVHELGYEPVTVDMLACKPEEIGFKASPEGFLVRGPNGGEMIYRMAAEDRKLLEQAQTEANNRGIGSRSTTQAQMAEAAGKQFGDEAGSYLASLDGQVIDQIAGTE
jgi:hypothetical protein